MKHSLEVYNALDCLPYPTPHPPPKDMFMSLSLEPQNGNVFEKRVLGDVITLRWGHTGLGWALNPLGLHKSQTRLSTHTHTHTHRLNLRTGKITHKGTNTDKKSLGNTGRDWNDAATGQEKPSDGSVIKNPPANVAVGISVSESGRSHEEGNGYPLQYSCLGNSMARGAWPAAVHGVSKSWTLLRNMQRRKNSSLETSEETQWCQNLDFGHLALKNVIINSFILRHPSWGPLLHHPWETNTGWSIIGDHIGKYI